MVLKTKQTLGKPHISKKMRELLKKTGKPVCIRDLTQSVVQAPVEEVPSDRQDEE